MEHLFIFEQQFLTVSDISLENKRRGLQANPLGSFACQLPPQDKTGNRINVKGQKNWSATCPRTENRSEHLKNSRRSYYVCLKQQVPMGSSVASQTLTVFGSAKDRDNLIKSWRIFKNPKGAGQGRACLYKHAPPTPNLRACSQWVFLEVKEEFEIHLHPAQTDGFSNENRHSIPVLGKQSIAVLRMQICTSTAAQAVVEVPRRLPALTCELQ